MKIPKMYIGIAVVTILLILVALWYRRRTQSKYTYDQMKIDTTVTEPYSNIVQCQVTYNTANLTATTQTARDGIMTTFNRCVRSNTYQYIDRKCTWLDTDPTQGSTEYPAYTQFVNDQNAIKTAYMDLITRSDATTSPKLEVVEAAMKADITGATRRYLVTVCPGYFNTPGTGDPTSTYSAWSVVTGSTAPTAYSFYAGSTGKITAAAVTTWAAKAASYTSATPDQLGTGGVDPFTVGTPYLSTGSTYNSNTTIAKPGGGFYLNWEIARDNGPGTINPQA